MRTDRERIALLHKRAGELQKRIDRMYTRLWGIASAALFVCLTWMTVTLSGGGHAMTDGTAAGSSLLSDNAGGYVLAAVLAFMFGVLITAFLIRRGHRRRKNADAEKAVSMEKTELINHIQEDEK